jgi:hypothetical protein
MLFLFAWWEMEFCWDFCVFVMVNCGEVVVICVVNVVRKQSSNFRRPRICRDKNGFGTGNGKSWLGGLHFHPFARSAKGWGTRGFVRMRLI